MNTRRLVYIGRRRGSKGLLIHVYKPLEDGDEMVFSKSLVSGVAVGYILEVTHPEGQQGSVYTRGEHAPKVVGFLENDDRVIGWQAEDRAAYQVKAGLDAAKRQEARSKDRLLEYHVENLARAASGLGWQDQEAFITYVANRIRRGS